MEKTKILKMLEAYIPFSSPEQHFKKGITEFIRNNDIFYSRENLSGHLTCSVFIVNPSGNKILLLNHRKLKKWVQPGGHIEADPDLFSAALREACEETGLTLRGENAVFDLDIHLIPENSREPEHYHYDIRFLMQADSENFQTDEGHELRWFLPEEVPHVTAEESVLRMVSKFLIAP